MNFLDLYLSKTVEDGPLVGLLSQIIGFPLESLETPDERALGFVMVVGYEDGDFPTSVNISWPPDRPSPPDPLVFAQGIATTFAIAVAYEAGALRDAAAGYWVLVDENGLILGREEDADAMYAISGLVLRPQRRMR